MRLKEAVKQLRSENEQLKAENGRLLAENNQLREEVIELEKRVGALEKGKSKKEPPAFVKPKRASKEKKARKKRAEEHNRARRREQPTGIEQHALERCGQCDYQLRGESEAYRRQVIELPPPQPIEVIEHVLIKRWCPVCGAWQMPAIDWQQQVVGQGRVGVRLASLIAYLRQSLRLPLRQIQHYLLTLHQVHLSVGEISELLCRLGRQLGPAIAQLKETIQQQAVVNGDETGWREDGENGYIWCLATGGERPLRYFEYDRSRAGAVVTRLLGENFGGHLVSDFYAAYNIYAGPHQRCWAHLLRDLHQLKADYDQDGEVVAWALSVQGQYRLAKEGCALPQAEREQLYESLWLQSYALGLQYAQAKEHPCQTLAKRLLRHLDELYQFLLYPAVPADNNLAERALRPLVVQRKISGGSRSRRGSQTRLGLASLCQTWQAQGLNPFHEFLHLLTLPRALSP